MSSLKRLKEKFDRVIIKYTDKSCEVLIVKGLEAYLGRSKCHESDNFDRKLGRTIALGRAEFAYKISLGEKVVRDSCGFYFEGAKYRINKFDDVFKLDEFVVSFLPDRKSHKAS